MALFTPSGGGLIWNGGASRYIGTNGRFLSPLQIREIIDEDIKFKTGLIRGAFNRLQRGEITIAEWQTTHGRLIKQLHIANYAAATGGYHKLTKSDLGRIGARVKKQYRYLERFAAHLAANPHLIQRDAMLRRAESYAQAGRATFEEERLRQEINNGARWARRVRHSLEPCAECATLQQRGWIPVAEMPPIGSLTSCNIHCRCTIEYAYTQGKPRRSQGQTLPPQATRKYRQLPEEADEPT